MACGSLDITTTGELQTISIASVPTGLLECSFEPVSVPTPPESSTANPNLCFRCPSLEPGTAYTIYAVLSHGPLGVPGAVSNPLRLHARTTASPTPPALLRAPSVSDVSADAFTVNYAVDRVGGGIAYAVTYARLSAPFFAEHSLLFRAGALTASEILAHANAAHAAEATGGGYTAGGVVAAGFRFSENDAVAGSARVSPRCSADACAVTENLAGAMLAPATEYVLWSVALAPEQVLAVQDGGAAVWNDWQGAHDRSLPSCCATGMLRAVTIVVSHVRLRPFGRVVSV